MKKRCFVLMLLFLMTLVFAGCGKKKAMPNFEVPEGGYDGSAVTITFYHTMGTNLRTVLTSYIEEFNKIYPNITVVEEQVGSYDDVRTTISTEITEGNQPNIAYCYPDHVALYNLAGAVATLDNLINSTEKDGDGILGLTQEQKDDFIEGYYAEGQQFGDGLMYTLPFSKSTEVLYYNKTFFEANGLTVPKTWDEMEALCKKIKSIDPNSIPLGYDSSANWFITMCEQLGSPYTSAEGDHYLFNNKTNRDFVKKYREWYKNGYVTTQDIYGSYTSGLFVSTDTVKSYMSIGSSAGATHQRPTKDANGNYLLDENGERIPVSRGSVYDGMETYDIYATTPRQAQMLRDVIASATKMMDYDTSIINIVKEEAAAYFAGQKTAQEVCKLIQSKANIYINEQK